jgi:hypothetical protein
MYSQDLTIRELIGFVWKVRPAENNTPVMSIVKNVRIRIDQGELMVKLPDLGIEVSAGAIKKALGKLDQNLRTSQKKSRRS